MLDSACTAEVPQFQRSARPGVAPGVCALDAVAHVPGGRHGVAHDVDGVRQVAVHLGHAVPVAFVLRLPATAPDRVQRCSSRNSKVTTRARCEALRICPLNARTFPLCEDSLRVSWSRPFPFLFIDPDLAQPQSQVLLLWAVPEKARHKE